MGNISKTVLEYSLKAVDAAIEFIQTSGSPQSYSLAPINEPLDVENPALFGTPDCLTDSGAAWVAKYILQVLQRVQAVNAQIPVMFQGSFKGESYWSSSRGASAANLTMFICQDAVSAAGACKFPVFVGE
ncbi:uncharacterized protein BO97DRAFT_429372 [Aspergillus homomorphus CBS 101889]|uniref:Glycoside hydrolase n=1 Tax=Aspergillus homomorphus (strain CBS 101889) TaxID=1450537 RepID=A0A395HIS0_ASPHC|nr:hypothetical protein BO97DRAFT_429372 [Aspergillus homomorphus CBS 101889]RAL07333.1 hypothetical protein BO97DRAFT_429372 [Aspergillus homomorphus CBS 101889]